MVRLNAQQVENKLRYEEKIFELKGLIKFHLGTAEPIIVKQCDVVGNIMQEWLQSWFDKHDVAYLPSDNTQMPPDFYLNPDDKTKDLLEVKAFNINSSPAFDIASFSVFQREIIENPEMLDVNYLIFGYEMKKETGDIEIKKMWLKKIWDITRPMIQTPDENEKKLGLKEGKRWPITLQIKKGRVEKLRPGSWYSNSRDYKIFGNIEPFLSAIEEAVYQNSETKPEYNGWKQRLIKKYRQMYGITLNIPKWDDIRHNYLLRKEID